MQGASSSLTVRCCSLTIAALEKNELFFEKKKTNTVTCIRILICMHSWWRPHECAAYTHARACMCYVYMNMIVSKQCACYVGFYKCYINHDAILTTPCYTSSFLRESFAPAIYLLDIDEVWLCKLKWFCCANNIHIQTTPPMQKPSK